VILFTTTGCKQDEMDDIRIAVTNYPNEYITEKLYGDHATVTAIYPDSVNPSEYTVSKKQKQDFSKYDLFIYMLQKEDTILIIISSFKN
jgi:ABC-type Zn uptake system ZnuABC Zn-binding protein ZnuA